MNLYIRYFDNETLVHNVEDGIAFLSSIQEIELTPQLIDELKEFANSKMMFPKRYKVRPNVYFIVIKTEAVSMQDFKDKKALRGGKSGEVRQNDQIRLSETCYGWYEGVVEFKRVITNHLGKCEYRDTTFTARCKANSPIDCYNRIVKHLSQRVDERSQFPSSKGRNFSYTYLGKCK